MRKAARPKLDGVVAEGMPDSRAARGSDARGARKPSTHFLSGLPCECVRRRKTAFRSGGQAVCAAGNASGNPAVLSRVTGATMTGLEVERHKESAPRDGVRQ
jgi:hypothetical protein